MTAKNRIAKYLWTFIKYFSLILAGFILKTLQKHFKRQTWELHS